MRQMLQLWWPLRRDVSELPRNNGHLPYRCVPMEAFRLVGFYGFPIRLVLAYLIIC